MAAYPSSPATHPNPQIIPGRHHWSSEGPYTRKERWLNHTSLGLPFKAHYRQPFSDVLGKRQSSKAVRKTLAAFLAQMREVGLDNVACSVSPQAAVRAPNARWCLRRVT